MAEDIIKVNALSKKFGKFTAVDKITFSVKRGEIFGFLGANGAGKTTCIKMLCGLLQPTTGIATVGGFDIYKETEKIKLNIGYMSQKFSLYEDLTVTENIELYAGIYQLSRRKIKSKTEYLLNKLGLFEVRNKFIKALPLGWKQKLAFSIAIIHDPKIVFLDEPTSGVDPITRRQFWELIYEASANGITVFVTTHYMDEAEYCQRISIMHQGIIEALDTPSNLKKKYQAESMNDVFLKIVR
ncbi:MAG: ABC transporter ATP-binding protein [Candidatus Cloacimonadota bacterium]|nr:MAG: ABC transporter ATP-binding protein [Candidatus Cloacimonadota bacterium]